MRSALIWTSSVPTVCKVLVEAEPLECLDAYWQDRTSKPEAGGILLGFRRGAHLHVTAATVPQPVDHSNRYWFKRSATSHQEIALTRSQDIGQTMDYLGDWHTHPEPRPIPSGHDVGEWRKICASRPQPMVFAIVGWSGEIWLGVSHGSTIARCLLQHPS